MSACGQPRQRPVAWASGSQVQSQPRRSQPLRPSIAGFFLGAPFFREVDRCNERGRFTFAADNASGVCNTVIEPIGYPVEQVFLRRCGRELCQITVHVPVEGETQLQHALDDVLRTWTARYRSEPEHQHETDAECNAELLATRYGCLLRGEARFLITWSVSHPQFRTPAIAQVAALGRAGTQIATIYLTLATAEGIEASRRRDL